MRNPILRCSPLALLLAPMLALAQQAPAAPAMPAWEQLTPAQRETLLSLIHI